MKKKFDRILLIDDSEADNFFHRINIENTGLVNQVECCESAESALDYLGEKIHAHAQAPELIFLDINMPSVDGWDFLEHYQEKIAAEQRASKIFVLSTSMNPADRARAESHPLVSGYISKPLDSATFTQLTESL